MVSIVGYQYNSENWCCDCIEQVAKDLDYDSLEEWAAALLVKTDEEYSYDTDHFPKVINGLTEAGDTPDHCCKCHELLDTLWHGGTVEYAVAALEQYVLARTQGTQENWLNLEALDAWSDRLGNCNVDRHDQWMIDLYDRTREYDEEIKDG